MKKLQLLAISAALCAGAAHAAPDAPKAPEAGIAKIFTHDVIGANVSQLEKIAGKPVAVDKKAGTQRYKVGACEVTAYMKGEKTASLEMETSPQCTFDLAQIFDSAPKGTWVHTLNYGTAYIELGEGRFTADCLAGCSGTPSVYMTWEGPHSDNFLQLRLQTELRDKNAKTAAAMWTRYLREKESTEYLETKRFNTDSTYDEIAALALSAVTITRIRIGHGIVKED